MLKTLSIRNVVLIEKLDLDFADAFNVLSGETGAGKSMLLDSLGLLLGQRADTGLIRFGADKLGVSGVFEIKDKHNPFFDLCAENDVDVDDEIIVKRSLSRDGKSRIFINDQPVSQRFLKEAGALLVEIHGQFDNQGLLNPATHRAVLDRYGVPCEQTEQLAIAYRKRKDLIDALLEAEENFRQAVTEEENLRHWVDELKEANVQKGEEETLNNKHTALLQSEKIIENLNTAYSALHGQDVAHLIQKAQNALARANQATGDRFADIAEALETAAVQVDEAVNRLETASEDIASDFGNADQIEERLFSLKALARKHRVTIDELPDLLADMQEKLQAIDTGSALIITLQKELKTAEENYKKMADNVHKLRMTAAERLDRAVMAELPMLKMERAVFKTEIADLPETQWSAHGTDSVTFTVSTNPNSPQGPLNKIASGGELSRFMLALKVNLTEQSGTETLVFDEIDAGISGATAQAVGERLAKLSKSVQVLVVTHAPQVAAFGDCNFKVGKKTENNITTTTVCLLNADEKREEIARMLSGEKITQEARAAAIALIMHR